MIAGTVCALGARTAVDPLDEAHWICRKLQRTVWFEAYCYRDPKTYELVTTYRIFRRGMGKIAERSSPAALLAFLRKQLPPT